MVPGRRSPICIIKREQMSNEKTAPHSCCHASVHGEVDQQLLGIRFMPLSEDPQIVGALGAAVFAAERFKRLQKKRERSDTH